MSRLRTIVVAVIAAGLGGGAATSVGAPILARVAGHQPPVALSTTDGLLVAASLPGSLLASALPTSGEPLTDSWLCFASGFFLWSLAGGIAAALVLAVLDVARRKI